MAIAKAGRSVQKDMTVGNPWRIILEFTLPLFLGNIFNQFYSMADTIIVGRYLGTSALAAVGSTGTVTFFINGFVFGLMGGFTLITAQKFGAGDLEGMRKSAVSALMLTACVVIVMTTITTLGMRSLLTFMQTPADIFEDAYSYVIVIFGGMCFEMLYGLTSSLLRALGNSRVPLYFLIVASGLNIVLDIVFIVVFEMGVAGAAWATVTAQGISGLLCLLYIAFKVPILHPKKQDFIPDKKMMGSQLRVGLPMALQFSITAIGSMMNQTALNTLGSTHVAAYTAAGKVEMLLSQGYGAMGTAIANYSAQNVGAGNFDRIRKGFRATTVIGVVYSLTMALLAVTVGKYMIYIFIAEDVSQLMGLVETYLFCLAPFLVGLAFVNIYRNGIQGLGYGVMPMMAGIAELIGRGVVAIIAAANGSYLGVCLASPAAWTLASSLLIFMYFYIMHHDREKLSQKH